MMIDFALDAERTEHRAPEDAIFQAALLRFRPILMTTLAALFAGLPLALGTGTGLRAPAPARNRDCRRPHLQPAADALHDAGRVSGLRPPGDPASPAGGSAGSAMNISAPVHRAADRDDAADDRHRVGRRRGLPASSGLAAAASRVPDDPGLGRTSGRQPGDDGVVGCHAARTSIRTNRRPDGDDLGQPARLDADRAAVRPLARHQRRRAGRAGRDQRRAKSAAREPAQQPKLSEGQSF